MLTTKAKKVKEIFGNNYLAIGFYNPKRMEIVPQEMPPHLKLIFADLEALGIKGIYGRWVEAGDLPILLLDTKEFEARHVNWIKTKFWEVYKIDSLFAGPDYNEPIAWSFAAGMVIERLRKYMKKPLVLQFHEWLSAGALLYLKMNKVPVATVFTTHATVLGRAAAGAGKELKGNLDELAKSFGGSTLAKHHTEKAAAEVADVFTTVSEITGEEAELVLGRAPDVITYNAVSENFVPAISALISDKVMLRERLIEFIRAYFLPYYFLDLSDHVVLFTSGRYEFTNKGFDLFIDAIAELNNRLKAINFTKPIFAFLLVPTATLGVKDEVVQNFILYRRVKELVKEEVSGLYEKLFESLNSEAVKDALEKVYVEMKRSLDRFLSRRGRKPPVCAFQLSYPEEQDAIIRRLLEKGLDNRQENVVKVVYYPVYLNKQDELLGLTYSEFVTASSAGIFLSRYEPWGYTPMEAAGKISIALTTDVGGFGLAVKKLGLDGRGIFVVNMKGKSNEEIVKQVADILEKFVKLEKDERLAIEVNASRIVKKHFTWKRMIRHYMHAYELALKRFAKNYGISFE